MKIKTTGEIFEEVKTFPDGSANLTSKQEKERWIDVNDIDGIKEDIQQMLLVLRAITPNNTEGERLLNQWIKKYKKLDTCPREEE